MTNFKDIFSESSDDPKAWMIQKQAERDLGKIGFSLDEPREDDPGASTMRRDHGEGGAKQSASEVHSVLKSGGWKNEGKSLYGGPFSKTYTHPEAKNIALVNHHLGRTVINFRKLT